MSLSEHAPSAPLVAAPPFAATVNQPRSRLAHALATLRAAQPQAAQPDVVWRTPQVVQPGVVRRTTQAAEPCVRVGPVVPTQTRRPAPPTLAAPAHPVHQLINEAESRAARPVVVSEVTFAPVSTCKRRRPTDPKYILGMQTKATWDAMRGVGEMVTLAFQRTWSIKIGNMLKRWGVSDDQRSAWQRWTWIAYHRPCWATGYTLGYDLKTSAVKGDYPDDYNKWSFSVQETHLSGEKGVTYKNNPHVLETCHLVLMLSNCRESASTDGIFTRFNLPDAWIEQYEAAVLFFSQSDEENAADEVEAAEAFRKVFCGTWEDYHTFACMLVAMKKNDTTRKVWKKNVYVRDIPRDLPRDTEFVVVGDLARTLLAQSARCATGYALFSVNKGARFPSLNRWDDTVGHTFVNTRWVCRLFSNHSNATRADFLHIFLNQDRLHLSHLVRERATNELARLGGHPRQRFSRLV